MEFLLLSFIAGVLTVLAPCILPLLPVIIGGSVQDNRVIRPVVITVSLAASIVLFTLVLKASTVFIDIPQAFWTYFSGGIILLFAISLLFPITWAKMMQRVTPKKFSLKHASEKALFTQSKKEGLLPMVLMGAALGPVFASCSPTYFLILGTVLPQSFFVGLLNLVVYALGLSLIMFVVAFAGQKALGKLNIASDPKGWFKRGLGILFLLVSIGILTGIDKKIEVAILDSGFNISNFEQKLLDQKVQEVEESKLTPEELEQKQLLEDA